MTPEHFVVWLTGFLRGMKFGNEKLPLANILEDELKKIDMKIDKNKILKEESDHIVFNNGCKL